MSGEVGQLRQASKQSDGVLHLSRFEIGGVSVQMRAERPADVNLVPSLEPFRVAPGNADVEIQVSWVPDLPPASGRAVFDSGTTWGLSESDGEFQFDFNAAVFGDKPFKRLLIDRKFCSGQLQMNQECLDDFPNPVEPLGYPLDELLIMHRLTQEKAIELHGCGIVRPDGTGNLFVGHSGAGKSTTTQLWTSRENVEILSDDRIIVRRDFSGCAALRMYGTPWHGEAMYASPGSATLAQIFVLEHGQGNLVTRLSRSEAVAELFARSFVPFHRHEYVDAALMFLEEVVDAVPVYRFAFEPDSRAVEAILNFHD
ncbi:MAG: hypothetical protein WAM79_21590 [Candidatus Sulfotelmatobacter sp.]